ncbi:MAG: hypothetical protein Q7J48_18415 [Nocardioides sp.]|nr:hypothetical protein [Nocardioides sp.]
MAVIGFPGQSTDDTQPTEPHPGLVLVRFLDIAAKVVLLLLLALVAVNPEWGNLEGKAPVTRAITYPMFAFILPVVWVAFLRARRPFPWVADLLVTLACFSDILGNRLDLYDQITWFDDWMHFMDTGLVSAAVVILTLDHTATLAAVVERAIAVALTASLAWELFEYFSFVTRSSELTWAYADTLGDLTLGWLGSVLAALLIHATWRTFEPPPT